MKKFGVILAAALAALLVSCGSTSGSPDDQAIARGVSAWNNREPEAANAYWADIADSAKQKKYLNYINVYKAGVDALDSTDAIKATNEAKLLSACNTALSKFSSLDPALTLPGDVAEKGANLTAERVNKLLAAERISEAKKMYTTAVKVYGTNDAMETVGKEIDVVNVITAKKTAINNAAKKAESIEDFDAKIAAFDAALASIPAAQAEVDSAVQKSGVGNTDGVSVNAKSFKKIRQDVAIMREAAVREKAYEFKDRIGEEFARQPAEGTGTGKNGAFTSYDIRDHYKSVQANMNVIYDELLAFQGKYPKDVGKDVIDDVKAMMDDLNAKIAQINKEIAVAEEIASRGNTVMPLMIGLFNPAPGSSAESKKSRPAKFSGKNPKKADYWWGMVSIPKGQMNDLVITLKDNRNVRVFNQNTHSGKDIDKKGLKNLVSMSNKVGNSWPVMNVGSQLNGGSNYFFEIQNAASGKDYSGEVVVYSSFVTRSR